MNKQEILDAVVAFMRKQRKPSGGRTAGGGSYYCRYRGPDGTKCAIGALIPDSIYDEVIEGKPIDDVLHGSSAIRELFVGVDPAYLMSLQGCHDAAAVDHNSGSSAAPDFMASFERRVERIARMNELVYTPEV